MLYQAELHSDRARVIAPRCGGRKGRDGPQSRPYRGSLLDAVDREVDGLQHRLLDLGIGENAEGVAGDGAVMAGAFDRIAERAMAVEERHGVVEVAVLLVEFLQRPAPERPLLVAAAAEGEDDGQGDLALAEVVAHALAHLVLGRGVVDDVVDELECDAQIEAIDIERFLLDPGPVGDDRADAAGGGEECRRLRPDDVEIGGLAGLGVVGGDQLGDLSLGDHRGRRGQDIEDLQRAVLDHELEGPAEQEIADQNAGLVAPDRVGRGQPAAQIAFVDDVVMKQRRGVDKLDDRGEAEMAVAAIAAEPGRGQCQHRAQALAAGRHDMAGKLGNQRDPAVHAADDDFVDPRQIVRGQRHQPVQARPPTLVAFAVKLYDNRQNLSPVT